MPKDGASTLSWDVVFPERGARASSWQRPRARLKIRSAERGEEELALPVAVGRRLRSAREGASCPSTREGLLALVDELCASCAHARMEDLIGRRDLSAHELSERLSRDGYRPQLVSSLVARAQESGLVDDERFAAAFVRSKLSAGWGRLKIVRELERRGVSADEVEGLFEELASEDDELERARELASRRRLTGRGDRQKLMRFLCGRGFSVGVASRAAREVTEAADETSAPRYHGLV